MYILCFDFQVKKTFKTYLSFCAACFVLFLSNIHLSLKKRKQKQIYAMSRIYGNLGYCEVFAFARVFLSDCTNTIHIETRLTQMYIDRV